MARMRKFGGPSFAGPNGEPYGDFHSLMGCQGGGLGETMADGVGVDAAEDSESNLDEYGSCLGDEYRALYLRPALFAWLLSFDLGH